MAVDHIAYGAESLEKAKVRFTAIAQLTALVIVTLSFSYPLIKEMLMKKDSNEQLHIKVKKVVNYSELSAPPPIDLERVEPKLLKNPPKIKTVKFLQPVAKKDDEVLEEEMPTMEEMATTQIADFNQDGIDSIVVNPEETIEVVPEEEGEVFGFVEKMPEFKNGGEAGFFDYLSKEIKYPGIAKEAGIKGTVYVAFVIETDGSISNVQIIRSVHKVLDKEATRVILNMPKWNPGEQNGRAVRVKYTVPIKFSLVG